MKHVDWQHCLHPKPILHSIHRRMQMANIAQTVNVLQGMILTEEDGHRMVLTPANHVYEMGKVHQDATQV